MVENTKISAAQWELRDRVFSEENMYRKLTIFAQREGLEEVSKALPYMKQAHEGQYRKPVKGKSGNDPVPYIIHPLLMCCHAHALGIRDDVLLTSILLHDVCEDCGVSPEELPFSPEVQEAVALLTKDYDNGLSKEENETRYYDALKSSRLAAMAKVIDRCNNVSTMAGCFSNKKIADYIDETEDYVFPVLTAIKQTWPEYTNAVFLIKYQMLSVLESLKIMLSEK